MISKIIIGIILIYLYGSIPFSYIIGKVIYKKDIRKEGSQNIGGSNLGRICGKKAFILGFICDASKGAFAVVLGSLLGVSPIFLAPFALLGHSYSIFMKFKGGKGVSTVCGFVLAYSFFGAIFALTIFVLVLYLKKYVSFASLVAIFSYLIYSLFYQPLYYTFLAFLVFLAITFLHRTNIKRILAGTENKITWM